MTHDKHDDLCAYSHCDTEWAELKADRDACIEFIKTELKWCDFRGDFMGDNASVNNARKLAEFLDRHKAAEKARA